MEDSTSQFKTEQTDLRQKIMQKIAAGEVSMKPKAHFLLQIIALVFLAVLIFITTVFLISYTLFSIVVSGHLLLLGFGWRGLAAFVMLFPWLTFLVDILLLIGLDWIVRRFRFGYNRSITFLFFSTTVVFVSIGYIVSVTSFHGSLLHRAEQKQLPSIVGPMAPAVQPLYDHMRMSHREHGVIQGVIIAIYSTTFVLQRDDFDNGTQDATTTVIMPPGSVFSTFLHVGNHVLVGGDVQPDGKIQAYGVTKFDEQ